MKAKHISFLFLALSILNLLWLSNAYADRNSIEDARQLSLKEADLIRRSCIGDYTAMEERVNRAAKRSSLFSVLPNSHLGRVLTLILSEGLSDKADELSSLRRELEEPNLGLEEHPYNIVLNEDPKVAESYLWSETFMLVFFNTLDTLWSTCGQESFSLVHMMLFEEELISGRYAQKIADIIYDLLGEQVFCPQEQNGEQRVLSREEVVQEIAQRYLEENFHLFEQSCAHIESVQRELRRTNSLEGAASRGSVSQQ